MSVEKESYEGSAALRYLQSSMKQKAAAGIEADEIDLDTAAQLLVMGLRALLDHDHDVRSRAFALVRRVLGDVLLVPSRKGSAFAGESIPEGEEAEGAEGSPMPPPPPSRSINRDKSYGGARDNAPGPTPLTCLWLSTKPCLRPQHRLCVLTRSRSSSALRLNAAWRVTFPRVREIFNPNGWARPEWGGLEWTAKIAANFSLYVTLTSDKGIDATPTDSSASRTIFEGQEMMSPRTPGRESVVASTPGNGFLDQLLHMTLQFNQEKLPSALTMWSGLVQEAPMRVGHKTSRSEEQNLHVYFTFSSVAHAAKDFLLTACREINLCMYSAYPETTARTLCFPLTFVGQHPEVELPGVDSTSDGFWNNPVQAAESCIVLLSEMAKVNFEALVSWIPSIFHFCLLHFPSSLRPSSSSSKFNSSTPTCFLLCFTRS